MHRLLVMDKAHGHATTEWAPPSQTSKKAVESRKTAKAIFDEVMARPEGWSVIAMAPAEVEGTTLKKFDPNVEEMIAIAPVAGG